MSSYFRYNTWYEFPRRVYVVPTYEYRCASCEHQFERFQRISDEPVKECELCGQPVQRMLFPVAIHFKGSGFYTTDYAKKSTVAASSNSNGNGKGGEQSTSSDANDGSAKKEAAPAAAAGADSKTSSSSSKKDE
jgi:putative FmdB family regulatory protein